MALLCVKLFSVNEYGLKLHCVDFFELLAMIWWVAKVEVSHANHLMLVRFRIRPPNWHA
jgi:hypothetical protein